MNLKKRFALITALIGGATVAIHIINRVITLISTFDSKLNKNNGSFYNWRFGEIFYRCKGSGSPILLIHDLECYSSSYEWNNIVNELSKSHTVYCVDLLGCGRSGKPNITYTNFLYVQLISDFIKDIIQEKTDIVASNNSSSLPIMTASFEKTLINRIILINPLDINLLKNTPNKKSKTAKWLINTPILGTLLYNILNSKRRIKNQFINNFYSNPQNIINEDIDAYFECAHLDNSTSKHLLASIKGNYLNTNINHALEILDTSIYIIASDNSPNHLTFAEIYRKYMPSIEIFITTNTNKYPQLENPNSLINQLEIIFDSE